MHEFGHVAGLDHVNAPRDGCLTMYRFATSGETQKRTLGLGDRLGMDVLCSTGDTALGPGCGFYVVAGSRCTRMGKIHLLLED